MRATVDASELHLALRRVARAAAPVRIDRFGRRVIRGIPILTHVKAEAIQGTIGGRLRLLCTDLEVADDVMIHADVQEVGSICVPAGLLRDIADRLRDLNAPVSLHDEFVEPGLDRKRRGDARDFNPCDDRLVVTCGPAQFRLMSMPSEEFPAKASELPRPKTARPLAMRCDGQHAVGCAACANARRLVKRRLAVRTPTVLRNGGCPRIRF